MATTTTDSEKSSQSSDSSVKRGEIYSLEHYLQGKLLDHSGWGDLPRMVTPSDIDMCFDNRGQILYCELSSSEKLWRDIKTGQRRLYQSAVRGRPHMAVLCKHSVKAPNVIDSKNDIESFSVMFEVDGRMVQTRSMTGWPKFVETWFTNPIQVRQRLREIGYEPL